MPAAIRTDPELLTVWLELNAARADATITTRDQPLQALLEASLGQDMVQTALSGLTQQGSLRASPLFAIAGVMSRQQVAALGHSEMRVVHRVHQMPDGRWLLTLGVNFGGIDGSPAGLQPFVGSNNFAFYVSLEILTPVLTTRWRTNAAAAAHTTHREIRRSQHRITDRAQVHIRSPGPARL